MEGQEGAVLVVPSVEPVLSSCTSSDGSESPHSGSAHSNECPCCSLLQQYRSLPVKPSDRLKEMSTQELSEYFENPISEAAAKLGVGLTLLKKQCRDLGIRRWPYRKIKSIDNLISSVEVLQTEYDGVTPEDTLTSIRFLQGKRKAIQSRPDQDLERRIKALRQTCFKSQYKLRQASEVGEQPDRTEVIALQLATPQSSSHLFGHHFSYEIGQEGATWRVDGAHRASGGEGNDRLERKQGEGKYIWMQPGSYSSYSPFFYALEPTSSSDVACRLPSSQPVLLLPSNSAADV